MRIVVVGVGAVGGVLAALLHEAGVSVTAVARGRHLEAMRAAGLRLVSATRDVVIPVPTVGSLAEAAPRPGDVVVLAVKSQDTMAVLEDLAALGVDGVGVVCLQNGVENERVALRRVADVYGVCVMFPAAHLEPGVVHQLSSPVPGLLDVGRYPRGVDDTTTAISAAFGAAGFSSVARPDVMAWKYRKLLMNLGNAVEAVCGTQPSPGSSRGELYRAVLGEGEAVLAAAGIEVITAEQDHERRGDLLDVPGMVTRRAELGGVGGSTWQSLRRGQGSVETDYLTGEVVLLGRLHGVPTPANELFARLAADLRRRGGEPGSISPDEAAERLATAG
ncbi:MAG: ketopantoate reductase family protein [Desertimonas sp.]